ncbi:hypothetical protein BT93_G1107 [Corymbia citriodora subsp. variegata]|nr:hypothetical protein BT93_G1107 [Corymbia citriodora subsp. variegata]
MSWLNKLAPKSPILSGLVDGHHSIKRAPTFRLKEHRICAMNCTSAVAKKVLKEERLPSEEQRNWAKRSIYKVRPYIADLNRKAYQPQVVSFGPYHHGKEHLLPMEEHKHRALCRFLKRSGKHLEPFLNSLREWKLGGSEGAAGHFLELMITDGCFMLEILRTATQKGTQVRQEVTREKDGYVVNDPIFSEHGKLHIMPYIKRDMLMLENQLPMLVLERLVAVESNGKEYILVISDGLQMDPFETNHRFHCYIYTSETSFYTSYASHEFINRLVLNFFCSAGTLSEDIGKCLHVLDVYRKSLLRPEKKPKKDNFNEDSRKEIIRSATELCEHGIWFKKSCSSSHTDISFAKGVLKLPEITVNDITESVYLNLIVFEHFHVGAGNEVTSYIFLMDKIINDEKDVALLHAQGIIQNAIGSDKAVAEMFNSLCKELTLRAESSLDAVHVEVSEYCKKTWYTWMATLYHTYFKSPWPIISFIAAILLFALAIIETTYTIIYH